MSKQSRYSVSTTKWVFPSLREKLKEGYGLSDLWADLLAGMVVATVAIPLGMALAIASGVPPQYGLYTIIIAGSIAALLGGSRFLVTGPTAAFVVILAPITHQFGLGGLLVAGFMAGVILLLMGLTRMGRMIQFISHPVTTGFTAGIAIVIATLQLKDFFGLRIEHMPDRFHEKILTLIQSAGSFSLPEFLIGISTLLFLIAWPRFNQKIPAPLVALTFASLATAFVKARFPGFEIATIGNRFTYQVGGTIGYGIPQSLPHFGFPWNFTASEGKPFAMSFGAVQTLLPHAFAIAMLGAIESLLTAVVADGMAQTKHDPDAELVAQGIGNMLCPFFGGIAATGAIARTATNIRYGAKSPLASFFHAVSTLFVMLLFAPYVSYLPMAALAALLILVAYNMSQSEHFFHIVRVAPKSDVIVLLTCFFLTIIFDMVVGVSVGIVFAALLFMNRMAGVTTTQILSQGSHPHLKEPLPKEILLYEIAGPLFFGAAESAAEAISHIGDGVKAVIFTMDGVPHMDVTGLVAFESAVEKLAKRGQRLVLLVDVNPQPRDLLIRAEFLEKNPNARIIQSLELAVRSAKEFVSTHQT